MTRPAAIALDLGSTRFKRGLLNAQGSLYSVRAVPAPPLRGNGLIREADAGQVLQTANQLLDDLTRDQLNGVPLGIASQRSTFVIWNPDGKRPVAPMVSWQDRRAAAWCDSHPDSAAAIERLTGLILSPHYMGPKLAAMRHVDGALRDALDRSEVRCGNLDAWLGANWAPGEPIESDLSMAARTAMLDISAGEWSSELLNLYGVTEAALPSLADTAGRGTPCASGALLSASVADQAASALTVLKPGDDAALVNFGTGAFVLYPTADGAVRQHGYLTAPIFGHKTGQNRFVLEGTINGAGPAVDAFHRGPTVLPCVDLSPQAFAIPDQAGLGAPHWRAEVTLTLSAPARALNGADRRRVVLEGLLFRVYEILHDLSDGHLPERLLVSGGLAREPALVQGLAGLTGRAVEVLDEPEATLLGAARLAAGCEPWAAPATSLIEPSDAGVYLPEKFGRWKTWLKRVLDEDVLPKTP